MRIAVSSSPDTLRLLQRQTPHRSWQWQGVDFVPSDQATEVDAWVVFECLDRPTTLRCPPGSVIFVCGEPSTVRPAYEERFLDQFALLCGARDFAGRPSIRTQPMSAWHFGWDRRSDELTWDYDSLKRLGPADLRKDLALTAVTSDKVFTGGHLTRRRLLDRIEAETSTRDDVRFFGRGRTPIDDKAEAILPARFHLAAENSTVDDYWSEKLTDALLGWSVPVYLGAPNVTDYLPGPSMLTASFDDPDAVLALVDATAGARPSAETLEAMAEARALLLDTHNFFPAILRLIGGHATDDRPHVVSLRPERRPRPSLARRVARRARRRLSPR